MVSFMTRNNDFLINYDNRSIFLTDVRVKLVMIKYDKVFKNGPTKIFGRQPLKISK